MSTFTTLYSVPMPSMPLIPPPIQRLLPLAEKLSLSQQLQLPFSPQILTADVRVWVLTGPWASSMPWRSGMLIGGLVKFGELEDVYRLFGEMPMRDMAS
ncbi:hypothetical protein Fmac_017133 [Flemingia macrophylla]|uniref:Uncharacterized protein n=1 Tax=Flemingia macrophylla TaxID=520843 RepID=A0ABD1M1P9_9FABA